jgi:hypothetical protein
MEEEAGRLEEAKANYRLYLKLVPDGPNAERVKARLAPGGPLSAPAKGRAAESGDGP